MAQFPEQVGLGIQAKMEYNKRGYPQVRTRLSNRLLQKLRSLYMQAFENIRTKCCLGCVREAL